MISDSWERIRKWGAANAPAMLEDLSAGASEESILKLEAELGLALPKGFRESLKVHDGESDGWPCKVFADCGAYLGTEGILLTWRQRQEIAADLAVYEDDMPDVEEQIRDGIIDVDGPVRPKMFLREWIPIMDCNGDIFWALDMNPGEGGTPGQVIAVDWEGCSWKVVASSFAEFLETYADRLESGAYQVVEGQPTMEDF